MGVEGLWRRIKKDFVENLEENKEELEKNWGKNTVGDQIEVICQKTYLAKFRRFLQENSILHLQNIYLSFLSSEVPAAIDCRLQIQLQDKTIIRELDDTEDSPRYKFTFADFDTLINYTHKKKKNLWGNNLRITLWGSVAAELGRELDQLNRQNTLLFITSLSTNLWNDIVNASSTFSTGIYINLDIPEATIFCNSIQTNIELTPTKQGKQFDQNMLDSQTTITQMKFSISNHYATKHTTVYQTSAKGIATSTTNILEDEDSASVAGGQRIVIYTPMQVAELKRSSTKRARKVEEINSTPLESDAHLTPNDEQEMKNEDKQFQQVSDPEDDRLITFTKSVRK
ncbi:hypothetical protein GIB67_009162 [Kingdonia uniflora]|uniref:Uncharacterized protein n=1 Tax=Kingdonia uniflora TaxID=39325 RepID=A0A7J7N297_9MAGN|nr:hypothetical protein GIB67_009162 [Kingdonia uniflora]